MFAIMYEGQDGKSFRIYDTIEEMMKDRNDLSIKGYQVTVFDFDSDSKTFIEFYTI